MPHLLFTDHRDGDLDELHLRMEPSASGYPDVAGCAAELADLLAAAPSGPRVLTVGTTVRHTARYREVMDVLVAMRPPVERLYLGDYTYPDKWGEVIPEDLDKDGEGWVTEIEVPDEFWPAMRTLRHLVLHGDRLRLHAIRSPALTRLAIRCDTMSPRCVADLGGAGLPALDALEIWLGNYNYQWSGGIFGSYTGTAADLLPLLAADGYPALRHLRCCADIADELVEALAGSPLLRDLDTLDLSGGGLTDRGARFIAANQLAFSGLRRLDLDGNMIGTTGQRLLANTVEVAHLGTQREEFHSKLVKPQRALLFG
ncbi:hypothetical protein AB0F17_57345 [Nonomuraea sp. NPDC026600]|uniref:hypothetical protein n=1 Tax=Nonomuraea sp. NPDC026600 TaxID=3155363 RepID=UPI0033D62537